MQNNRIKALIVIFLCISILFTYVILKNTAILSGVNVSAEEEKEAIIIKEEKMKTKEGIIVDTNGVRLTTYGEKSNEAVCTHNAFSSLVGYNSPIYGKSNLRLLYEDELYTGKKGVGGTIQLTIKSELQQYLYDVLDDVGSIVVLNNEDASILGMVSKGSNDVEYNVNDIDEMYTTYSSVDEYFYNRAILSQDPPGSIFKIVTAASLIENEHGDYVYNDTGEYLGFPNFNNMSYGEVDITDAMVNSINTYFASAANYIGGYELEEQAELFGLNEEIRLDFAVMLSNIDLESFDSRIVAATGFGQGNTIVSPLNLTMIMQSIMADGKQYKPYLIKTVSVNNKNVYKGGKELLHTSVQKKTADKLKDILHQTALSYGFDTDTYGKVYAKSSTAQVENGDMNHISLVFSTEQFSGIISIDRSTSGSHTLNDKAKSIVKFLNNLDM